MPGEVAVSNVKSKAARPEEGQSRESQGLQGAGRRGGEGGRGGRGGGGGRGGRGGGRGPNPNREPQGQAAPAEATTPSEE